VADLFDQLPSWAAKLILISVAVAGGLLVHRILFALLGRGTRESAMGGSRLLVDRLCRPTRWLFVALALSSVLPALELGVRGRALWQRSAGLLTPALIGWLAIALLGALSHVAQARARIDVPDNLRARRRRTRIGILYRIAVFAILLVTICLMLMSIPSVRNIGVTLIASAGLAGLAVGAAAQPALKNLIAGIQLAFTEPIRIDDVVIIDGEWGRIEEIRLTYVVVKVWDERRLIVPVSKFLESSFQNWTRQTSQLLGTVSLHLDPTVDVPSLRSVFERLVRENERWDGRVAVLQVVDVHRDAMEVRGLVSAEDAGTLFDLRCDVREAMMAFIAREMPSALPRRREELSFNPPEQPAPRLLERIGARR
jgi:small-conductance mechanosensitive channel